MCTEAGMYALRERRVHVTQEDFELAVAKVMYNVKYNPPPEFFWSIFWKPTGDFILHTYHSGGVDVPLRFIYLLFYFNLWVKIA